MSGRHLLARLRLRRLRVNPHGAPVATAEQAERLRRLNERPPVPLCKVCGSLAGPSEVCDECAAAAAAAAAAEPEPLPLPEVAKLARRASQPPPPKGGREK